MILKNLVVLLKCISFIYKTDKTLLNWVEREGGVVAQVCKVETQEFAPHLRYFSKLPNDRKIVLAIVCYSLDLF